MTNPAKSPIQKPKFVSYESDMNTIWNELKPWADQQHSSPDGVKE